MIFTKTALCRILTYILPLIISVRAYAQDPQFSQFYANPMYVNPAFAGSSNVGRLVLNTRNQWPSISGSFTTVNASYDEHFAAINGGLGIQAHYDEQGTGVLKTVGLNVAYSYQIPVSRKFTLRLALQGGFMQKSVDFNKFLWRSQYSINGYNRNYPSEPMVGEGAANITNFAAGILGYSKNFYFGFSTHNMFQPDQSFGLHNSAATVEVPIFRRYTGHVGFVYPLNYTKQKSKASYLYPNVIYIQQGTFVNPFWQLNVGGYVSRGALVGGLYLRQTAANTDALIAIIGIRTEKVKIGFSYDGTLSTLGAGAPNSYEVSLAFELRKKVRRRNPRPMTCPDF